MLLNDHIGRLVLSSLCVGALVWLVLSGARVAVCSLQVMCVLTVVIMVLNAVVFKVER